MPMRRPRRSRCSRRESCKTSSPSKSVSPPSTVTRTRQQAHQRLRRERLARAAFADDAEDLARLQLESQILQRIDAGRRRPAGPARGAEPSGPDDQPAPSSHPLARQRRPLRRPGWRGAFCNDDHVGLRGEEARRGRGGAGHDAASPAVRRCMILGPASNSKSSPCSFSSPSASVPRSPARLPS